MKTSQPHICLFRNRRVKVPCLAVFSKQLWVHDRVAIGLTESIFDRVFAVEVKDVNGESNIAEVRIVLDVLGKGTVVVEKQMIWLLTVDAECTFYKLLRKIQQLNSQKVIK